MMLYRKKTSLGKPCADREKERNGIRWKRPGGEGSSPIEGLSGAMMHDAEHWQRRQRRRGLSEKMTRGGCLGASGIAAKGSSSVPVADTMYPCACACTVQMSLKLASCMGSVSIVWPKVVLLSSSSQRVRKRCPTIKSGTEPVPFHTVSTRIHLMQVRAVFQLVWRRCDVSLAPTQTCCYNTHLSFALV